MPHLGLHEGEGELLALHIDLRAPGGEVKLGRLGADDGVERLQRRLDGAEDAAVCVLAVEANTSHAHNTWLARDRDAFTE